MADPPKPIPKFGRISTAQESDVINPKEATHDPKAIILTLFSRES